MVLANPVYAIIPYFNFYLPPCYMRRVGQNHTYIRIYGVYVVMLAGNILHTVIHGVYIRCWPTLYMSLPYFKFHPPPCDMLRVGQNHTYIRIYSVYVVMLAGKLPYIRSYTVYIYGSGQPCMCHSIILQISFPPCYMLIEGEALTDTTLYMSYYHITNCSCV